MVGKNLTSRLKNIAYAGAVAGSLFLIGCGSGSNPPRPPPPSYSQIATLTNDVNINYTASFVNMNNPVRSITHDGGVQFNDFTIPSSQYNETLGPLEKGNYVFTLRTSTPNVSPITTTREVPNYKPTADFSSLDTDINENSQITFNLESAFNDKNLEDTVSLSGVTPLSGRVEVLGINGYDLTIKAPEIIDDNTPEISYELNVDFESAGNLESAVLTGKILNVPEQIAFWSNRDAGTGELYLGDIVGGNIENIKRLTNNGANDRQPAWSPDGSKLVFASNRDLKKFGIWEMSNFDGSDQAIKLTPDSISALNPVWCLDPHNPAGPGKIYYGFKDDFGKTGIASMSPGDSESTIFIEDNFAGARTGNPSCSPDGSEIAFSTFRDGNWEVYIANTDGNNQRNITNSLNVEGQPRWSLNNKIAFFTDRDIIGESNLYMMNPNGTGLERLTDFLGVEGDLSWYPNAIEFVFMHGPVVGPFHIYKMNTGGGGLIQLTTIGQNRYPRIKPKPNQP